MFTDRSVSKGYHTMVGRNVKRRWDETGMLRGGFSPGRMDSMMNLKKTRKNLTELMFYCILWQYSISWFLWRYPCLE